MKQFVIILRVHENKDIILKKKNIFLIPIDMMFFWWKKYKIYSTVKESKHYLWLRENYYATFTFRCLRIIWLFLWKTCSYRFRSMRFTCIIAALTWIFVFSCSNIVCAAVFLFQYCCYVEWLWIKNVMDIKYMPAYLWTDHL